MQRSRLWFIALSSLFLIPILAGSFLRAAQSGDAAKEEDNLYRPLAVFSEVLGLVRSSYVDEPDTRVLMDGALNGTTDALDPFSMYLPPEEVERFQAIRKIGQRHSGMAFVKDRGVAYVVTVENGGAASKAGLKVGDVIAKVGDRSTRSMPVWELQELLSQAAGTKLALEVVRAGETSQISLVLGAFDPPVPNVEKVQGASLLRVAGFGPETAKQVGTALEAAGRKGTDRLLVDLRGVSAGDPEAAYAVAELFAQGDLGSLTNREGAIQSFSGSAAPRWKGKLVILVDRGTLGAAEVLATVLRQKAGGYLVGERTFGHAGRQGMIPLSSGGRLLITDAFYSGPDKKQLRTPLAPDLLVDERSRTFLEKDVPIDDLILQRGVAHLLGQTEAKKAA